MVLLPIFNRLAVVMSKFSYSELSAITITIVFQKSYLGIIAEQKRL